MIGEYVDATMERMDALLPLRLLLEGEATRLATAAVTTRLRLWIAVNTPLPKTV